MSIFCGIIDFGTETQPNSRLLDAMLARLEGVELNVTRRDTKTYSFAYIDTRAFATPGLISDNEGRLTCTAGRPIVKAEGIRPATRIAEVECLHKSIGTGDVASAMQDCHGQFALFHADPNREYFLLASDKGGHRPLYYARIGKRVYFSTMLKLLEAIPEVVAEVDLRGLTELVNLGYPMGDRTPYDGVKIVSIGTFDEYRGGDKHSTTYFSLGEVVPFSGTCDDAIEELHLRFETAVKDRISSGTTQKCFLSGGLDSRVIAMSLHCNDVPVHAVTFDKPGYPDGTIATEFARSINLTHSKRTFSHRALQRNLTANIFDLFPQLADDDTRLIFSGDGGSVGVGLVYLTETIMRSLLKEDMASVSREFLSKKPLMRAVFKSAVYEHIRTYPFEGVAEELARNAGLDPLLRYYVFLMQNDQRRHLHTFYERNDSHRCEFLTPFYDDRVFTLIASCPIDWFMLHRAYQRWITKFPTPMMKTPWQTYPGHEPCPIGHALGNQWRMSFLQKRAMGLPDAIQALRATCSPQFPSHLLRRSSVLASAILHLSGVSNKRAAVRTASTICRYARHSHNNGNLQSESSTAS